MLKASVIDRRYTRVSIAERLLANSEVSDYHGDPAQPLPCLLTTYALDDHGYGVIRVDGRNRKTHIEAYKVWCGEIPQGMKVTHLCNTPSCFEPTHLQLGTQKQNLEYMAACGRSKKGRFVPTEQRVSGDRHKSRTRPESVTRGEASPLSKLTEESVKAIRRLSAQGQTHRQIASQFGINYANVSYIVRRKTWAHVGETV